MFNTKLRKVRLSSIAAIGAIGLAGGLLAACSSPSNEPAPVVSAVSAQAVVEHEETAAPMSHDDMHADAAAAQSAEAALYGTMRELWADHMQWTYATVKDFFHNQDALPATLDRLLQNQVDLGDAIASFYGEEAGAALTT